MDSLLDQLLITHTNSTLGAKVAWQLITASSSRFFSCLLTSLILVAPSSLTLFAHGVVTIVDIARVSRLLECGKMVNSDPYQLTKRMCAKLDL